MDPGTGWNGNFIFMEYEEKGQFRFEPEDEPPTAADVVRGTGRVALGLAGRTRPDICPARLNGTL